MKHMTKGDRGRIELLVSVGRTVPQVAAELGRSPSTIRRELLEHRVGSSKGYGRTNALCAHYAECTIPSFSATGKGLRRNEPKCFTTCPDFREAVCHSLAKPPFVCNGCANERKCPLPKKFYVAEVAQTGYESTLSVSRAGVRPDEAAVRAMDAALSPAVVRGQSVSAVLNSNADVFGGYARSTVYGWVRDGLFRAKGCDLPYAGRSRRPHKAPETKTNAQCRVGRTYAEMQAWLTQNPEVVPTEVDTVVGSLSGKVLFTMVFPRSGLALAFLRDQKTSQTCTRIFNALWRLAGPDLFRRLFAATLGDNGPEFSAPEMIENWRPDPEHNPTRLESRGVRFWYADPYRSCQKPHVERFHLELRRILQKGASFNGLAHDQIALAVSHLNSYPRESTGWRTPYDAFVEEFGDEGRRLLDALGVRKVPAGEVTLLPSLMGEAFRKAAERAVLKRNGVA